MSAAAPSLGFGYGYGDDFGGDTSALLAAAAKQTGAPVTAFGGCAEVCDIYTPY